MPRFEPFSALRYHRDSLAAVTAPPYDVLSDADRQALADRDPHNIVHVDVPIEAHGPDRYRVAGETLDSWIAGGTLELDPAPSFTVYRMTFRDSGGRSRTTVGVIGALEVVDEGSGGVLPHERTTPKAKTDRLDLTRATLTNLSPVWGLSLASGLSELLQTSGEQMGQVDIDGVVHQFERIAEPERVQAITQCLAKDDVVIADGHHRYAISRTFRDEQRQHDTGTNGLAELTMTFVQELVDDQLSVEAIHRLYSDVAFDALTAALQDSFDFLEDVDVTPSITGLMESRGCMVLLRPDGHGTLMAPKQEVFAQQRNLDGARLEFALAALDHSVSYQHGVDLAAKLVTNGSSTAGVLIRPVTVEEIKRTATEGLLMPPKSTFFTPKLLTGPVLRPLSMIR